MKKKTCPFESKVLNDLTQGQFSPELKNHVEECSLCKDSVLVYSWMNSFEGTINEDKGIGHRVPDFESLWTRARPSWTYDRELEKKAMAPLLIPRLLTYIAALIGLVLLLASNLSQARDVITDKLKMGYLFDLLSLVGKKMLTLMPYLVIPIVFVLLLIAAHFLYSLFNPKKV